MITVLLFVLLQITLFVCFIRYIKRKRAFSILFAMAFLLACRLFGLLVHFSDKGYSYQLDIAKKKLESFFIDLDSIRRMVLLGGKHCVN